jgi:threonine/homoserine/homoserine lactone efflux protein
MDLLFRGLVLGFSIAAPVGPIGLLCIRRSLLSGWRVGFSTGIGAACADTVYALLGVFGISLVSAFVGTAMPVAHIFGGLFLLYVGLNIVRQSSCNKTASDADKAGGNKACSVEHDSKPVCSEEVAASAPSVTDKKVCFGAAAETFVLTLTNPMTILSFASALAAFGAVGQNWRALNMVAGVFIGSAIWWLGLSICAARFRASLSPRCMTGINYLSATVISGLGLWCLLQR